MESQNQKFDLVIIGSGPGGYVAAIRAAQLKMKVALVERERLGGICLNWGCIPTKALLESAALFQKLKKAHEFGIACEGVGFDFPQVIHRSRQVSDTLNKGVTFLMKKNGIGVFPGNARLLSPSSVAIFGKEGELISTLEARKILVATGGHPSVLPGVSLDGERILTSREAMLLQSPPQSLVILGGGAIGIEFAYFYNCFGTTVTLVEMMPQILPSADAEISDLLARSLKRIGIRILTSAKVLEVKAAGPGVETLVEIKGETQTLSSEKTLMALGVKGNSEGFGLEELGANIQRSYLRVDEAFQTNIPGIYAIGDVIGPPLLAHVASAEGISAVEAIAEVESCTPVQYDAIPACIYCHPQVASLGWTEQQAREKGHELRIGRYPFRASGRAIAAGATEGLVKLVFDARYGELLGAHLLGPEVTELVGELALAKTLEGTAESILKTVHAHPTLGEAIMEAAGDALGEAINI